MTTATDLRPPRTQPSPGRAKRRARWVAYAGVPAIFLAGLVGGTLLPEGTAELDAANSGLRSSQDQVDRLDSDLAAAKLRSATLSESLEEAKDEAAAAGAKSQAAQKRLDAREAKLDEREHALEQREEDLGTDETVSTGSSAVDAPTGVEFDRAYAIDIGNDIVHDIKTVDRSLRDGIGVSTALNLLSDSYGRLLDAGIPPGVNESNYYGRVTTLQTFAEDAADLYYTNEMEGSTKYAVLREQTPPLLDQLNGALNSNLRLP